ncbi:hypothetical protein [Lysobacter gummosus]|uniref:hypothetical protein n=1 Tax=Lysobacter gummosus TaxID=262324 RepID=UPI00362A07C1
MRRIPGSQWQRWVQPNPGGIGGSRLDRAACTEAGSYRPTALVSPSPAMRGEWTRLASHWLARSRTPKRYAFGLGWGWGEGRSSRAALIRPFGPPSPASGRRDQGIKESRNQGKFQSEKRLSANARSASRESRRALRAGRGRRRRCRCGRP